MTDPVNHPAHYKAPNGLEAIDVIEGFGLGFHRGNAVKYLLRAGRKDDAAQDMRKARWYVERDLQRIAGDMARPSSVLAQYRLCYLATPYTKYHLGIEAAFVHAAEISALLLTTGVRVYSPIAHTHPLAVYGKLDPLDHSIWLPFDEAMMDAADCLIVARMKGWDESFGVKHEIEFFARERKPIIHIDPVTMQIVPPISPLQKEAM
jgi:hypothetical protein